jgi:hypothetical protein
LINQYNLFKELIRRWAMRRPGLRIYLLLLIVATFYFPMSCAAYSVLSHEAVIDACWEKTIQPLLKTKYPRSTEEQLKIAHAYAYGGAILDDMGYYPLGSVLFSNLVHYVRSGDFVDALLDEAQDIDEYAFALGALSHYISDIYGHPIGVNVSVPIVYPKDQKKYGNVVTYEQDHKSHLRMEFGFDVLQTAKGNYASLAYHNFIGFQVSKPVLERAFLKTYGMDLKDLYEGDLRFAVETFRWSVKIMIPEATRYAWIIKKHEITQMRPTATARNFKYKMKRANYYEEFGKKHKAPPIFSRGLSMILRILPKISLIKGLKFKEPGVESEKLFIQSFDTVMVFYTSYLNKLDSRKIHLENKDLDTGKPTVMREYDLADLTYNKLLLKLEKEKFIHLTTTLKQNIIAYYSHSDTISVSHKRQKKWDKVMSALGNLKNVQTNE